MYYFCCLACVRFCSTQCSRSGLNGRFYVIQDSRAGKLECGSSGECGKKRSWVYENVTKESRANDRKRIHEMQML
jgi:hypothetical protein